jgi:hypothetical protein
MITKIDVIGLPHFNKHLIASERVLSLIDEFQTNPDKPDKYYKLGISTVSSLEKFVAEQMIALVSFYQSNFNDTKKCDEETVITMRKIVTQSKSIGITLIIKVKIEFYSNDLVINEVTKGVLSILFINDSPILKMTYYTQVVPNVVKANHLSLKGYTLFKYLTNQIKVLPTTLFFDNNSLVQNDNNILQNAIDNLPKLFAIIKEYEDVKVFKDYIQYKNHIIKKIAVKTVVNSRVSSKLFVCAFVVKEESNAAVFYDNLLKDYDKEFTLIFIIAACLLYYKKTDLVVLTHTFRNEDSSDIITRLYQFMLSDYITSNNIFPQISIINS